MKWVIDKSFSFCYGHRVHNQRLNTKFTESGNACLACRHLHGHEGLVKVFLEEDYNPEAGEISNVEKTGMVTDFKHLGWMKNFIDNVLDHKFIMDVKDPLLFNEFPLCYGEFDKESNDEWNPLDPDRIVVMPEGYCVPNLTYVREWADETSFSKEEADAIFEKYEGAVFVNFVPTSENLAAWLLKIADAKMKELPGVKVKAIEYWETPKSHCRVEI